MSVSDDELVDRMAKKHAVSSAAVHVVLAALQSGGGRMAQFSHADFGGMSQWSPGMSMVGDMFNTQLKAIRLICRRDQDRSGRSCPRSVRPWHERGRVCSD
jgi:hypothetical protein